MRFNNGDYKQEFNDAVTKIINLNITDRQERMNQVNDLMNEYLNDTGKKPDGQQLERLTDYILREELCDTDVDKVTNNEYPIMSERQLERRRANEVSLESAQDIATDGKSYRKPLRRKRTIKELMYVDEHAKIRNKERQTQYRNDTRPSKLKTYWIEPNA